MEDSMSYQEKNVWVFGVTSLVAHGVDVVVVLVGLRRGLRRW